MARLMADQVAEPNSGPYKPTATPMTAYPTRLTREQFWYRSDGQPIKPGIDGMEPNTAPSGGSDIRLYVNGTGFTPDSVIVFNDNEEPTTMNSNGVLSTGVRPSIFVVPATVPVLVRTGAVESNTLNFTFT